VGLISKRCSSDHTQSSDLQNREKDERRGVSQSVYSWPRTRSIRAVSHASLVACQLSRALASVKCKQNGDLQHSTMLTRTHNSRIYCGHAVCCLATTMTRASLVTTRITRESHPWAGQGELEQDLSRVPTITHLHHTVLLQSASTPRSSSHCTTTTHARMLCRQVRAREMLRAWANVMRMIRWRCLHRKTQKRGNRRTRLSRFHDPTRRVVALAGASRITTSTPDSNTHRSYCMKMVYKAAMSGWHERRWHPPCQVSVCERCPRAK
jgi:hypothetical protein